MTRRRRVPVWALAAVLIAGWPVSLNAVQDAPATTSAQTVIDLARLPLSFEPNVAQADESVRFIARAPGSTMLFAPSQVLIRLRTPSVHTPSAAGEATPSSGAPTPGKAGGCGRPAGGVVRMTFLASSPTAHIEPGARLPGRVNYFLGKDRSRWRTDVPTYAAIAYRGLYPGVDLTYVGTEGRLKATFAVAPGSDPADLRWRYVGADAARVDEFGNLIVHIAPSSTTDLPACAGPAFTLIEHAPVAWQGAGARRTPVGVRYAIANDGSIGFRVGAYDPARPLIIDPTLTYSSYLGGNGADYAYDITVDGAGNAYIAGATFSADFPLVNPIQASPSPHGDIFVTKVNAAGSAIIYSTYLGGDNVDVAFGIAVDSAGNAYITGETGSTNFPTVNAFQPYNGGIQNDFFVAKLNPSGSALIYSTYLGGCCDDTAFDIAIDSAGAAYVTGVTISDNFPTANAFQGQQHGVRDIVVAKVAPSGSSLVYSTYLGGAGETEFGFDIAVDASGSAYVTGWTDSSDFPVVSALQPVKNGFADVFLTKFTPTGAALVYSTFLGGSLNDLGHSVAVDGAGNAYVSGYTESNNFPVQNAAQPTHRGNGDAFVAKVNAAGSALIYSTYLGGSNPDGNYRVDIKADGGGNAYVAGNTSSTNFPVLDAIQPNYGGLDSDVFVTKISSAGPLVYSTYLGGSTMAAGLGDYAYGIAIDGNGNAYVTGRTFSSNFPTKNPFQPANAGNYDAFVAKISSGTGGSCTGTGSFRISGRIRTSAGVAVAGVTMTLTGSDCTSTTITSARGIYAFVGLVNGIYTVAPSKPGCSFTPPSQTVTISGGNLVANFTATCL